jgi:hypothetical protein
MAGASSRAGESGENERDLCLRSGEEDGDLLAWCRAGARSRERDDSLTDTLSPATDRLRITARSSDSGVDALRRMDCGTAIAAGGCKGARLVHLHWDASVPPSESDAEMEATLSSQSSPRQQDSSGGGSPAPDSWRTHQGLGTPLLPP